jgi:hypothetical protein
MFGFMRHTFCMTEPTTTEELSALPIWSFTLGILALLTLGLTAVPAVICGHRALANGETAGRASLGRAVAITGLVVGYVGVVLLGVWIVALVRVLALS